MSFELPGAGAPEDELCRYDGSRLPVRGPRRRLDRPYIAFLGGGETFGRFVERPFVACIERETGRVCVNLGCTGTGLDAYVQDDAIVKIAAGAQLAVIQVMGAQNLSNRYYRVHPRRNDRFLAPSSLLSTTFEEVDFTEFHFNRHLLDRLKAICPARFRAVQRELQETWLARMRQLLAALPRKPVLLWLRYPEESAPALGASPLLVGRAMLARLRPDIAALIDLPVVRVGEAGELAQMRFGPLQAPAAAHMIGPAMHRRIAGRVAEVLRDILPDCNDKGPPVQGGPSD